MSDRLLVLVRHGQSEWNLKNLFTGWKDPDLSEQGIAEAKDAGRRIALDEHSARGRDGVTGERRTGDIGFASLRGGTAAGDHSVIFAGPHERITLSHHAEDRILFAHGALKAALWAHGKKPGLYSMADVLGLGEI